MFEKTMIAGWADMDFNSHMRNTAYLDRSADIRMLFFAENGFPMSEFVRMRIGPVVRKDEIRYFSEIGLLEAFRMSLVVAGLAADGSNFRMQNEVRRADGKLAARITSAGGWLDLDQRKLTAPPEGLLAALRKLPRADAFEELPPIIKTTG